MGTIKTKLGDTITRWHGDIIKFKEHGSLLSSGFSATTTTQIIEEEPEERQSLLFSDGKITKIGGSLIRYFCRRKPQRSTTKYSSARMARPRTQGKVSFYILFIRLALIQMQFAALPQFLTFTAQINHIYGLLHYQWGFAVLLRRKPPRAPQGTKVDVWNVSPDRDGKKGIKTDNGLGLALVWGTIIHPQENRCCCRLVSYWHLPIFLLKVLKCCRLTYFWILHNSISGVIPVANCTWTTKTETTKCRRTKCNPMSVGEFDTSTKWVVYYRLDGWCEVEEDEALHRNDVGN